LIKYTTSRDGRQARSALSGGLVLLLFALLGWWPGAWATPILPQDGQPLASGIQARSWLLMDHTTGWILAADHPFDRVAPASLTKVMTAYVVYRKLEQGAIGLDDRVRISKKSWRMRGSRMFLEPNTYVPVRQLLQGLIVQSGNDAAVALAEHVSGSEAAFAGLMNQVAGELGLDDSHFRNSTGLPARDHYVSARDMAVLVRALIRDFPQRYRLFSQKQFTYNNIAQRNRNALLWRDDSVDGVKTGYTRNAGYCMVTSAERDGMRLIAVVMGTKKSRQRTRAAQHLLDYGFSRYETRLLYPASARASEVPVFMGADDSLPIGTRQDLYVTIPKGTRHMLYTDINVEPLQQAPIRAGQSIGRLRLRYANTLLAEYPLVALKMIEEGNIWSKLSDRLHLLMH
jgi:D-alanyl-D-alanine carboxypeptidase (penicillin-binding protein 5/6)